MHVSDSRLSSPPWAIRCEYPNGANPGDGLRSAGLLADRDQWSPQSQLRALPELKREQVKRVSILSTRRP